jgi:hypothetical protein
MLEERKQRLNKLANYLELRVATLLQQQQKIDE